MRSVSDFENLNSDNNIDLMNTISYGFRKTFDNAKLWIIGSIILFFGYAILSGVVNYTTASTGEVNGYYTTIQLIPFLITFFLTPIIIGLALYEFDNDNAKFSDINKNIDYVNCLKVSGILYVVGLAIIGIISMVSSYTFLAPLTSSDTVDLNDNSTPLILFGVLFIVVLLVSFFVSPFFMFTTWLAADKKTTVKESFVQGFEIGKKHYTTILLWSLTLTILSIMVSLITLGLAMIIIMPALYLSEAFLYRQILESE